MPTPAYVPLNPNTPAGITQSPADYSASDLANVRALRDAVVCGFVPGWNYSQNGGATIASPVNRFWGSGALYLNAIHTYDGANPFLPVSIKWQWSNDGAATWADLDVSPAVITWTGDANGWAISAVSRGAGLWIWAIQALVNSNAGYKQNGAHAALTGTAVHGLGTMSTQNANAVGITGGNITSANLNSNNLNNYQRAYPGVFALTSGAAWDWAATGIACTIAAGSTIASINNHSQGEVKRLLVAGGGAVNMPGVTWATGHPVWGPNGTIVTFCAAVTLGAVIGTTIGY